jgi:Protein of unknown function (DUF4232)
VPNELTDLMTRATADLALDPQAPATVIGKYGRTQRRRRTALGTLAVAVVAAAIAVPLATSSGSGDVQRISPIGPAATTPTPNPSSTGATSKPPAATPTAVTPTAVAPATSAPAAGAGPTVQANPPVGAATTPPAASVTSCSFAQLRITAGEAGAGLGHSGFPLIFRNVGSTDCTIAGYPGVAGIDNYGRQVTQAERTSAGYLGGLPPGAAIPVVTLKPGDQASALIEGTDNPQGGATSCQQLVGILVTAPDTTQYVQMAQAPGDCSGLQIHPVVAGTTGSAS